MEKQSLITTVILTYKRPQWLKKAIQSVQHQTFSNIQIHVYDNASNDETEELVKWLALDDQRIKYYAHTSQIEAAENFQYGLSCVETPFFSILADDDLLVSDFYESALSLLSKFPKACCYLGSTLDVRIDGNVIGANALLWEGEYFEPPEGLYQLIPKYINWTGALFRREVLSRIQIDTRVKPIDFDFMVRLAASFPFVLSKKSSALFIMHSKSYSAHAGFKLICPSLLRIIQNLECIIQSPEVFAPFKNLMREKLKTELVKLTVTSIINRDFNQANRAIEIFEELKETRFHKNLGYLSRILKKCPVLISLLKMALFIYRARKIRFQFKNRKFAKTVLNQYSG